MGSSGVPPPPRTHTPYFNFKVSLLVLVTCSAREEADGLQQRVDDTGKLLSSYNSRLDQEREQRQHVIALLQAFIKDQASQQEKVQSLHDVSIAGIASFSTSHRPLTCASVGWS